MISNSNINIKIKVNYKYLITFIIRFMYLSIKFPPMRKVVI